MNAASFVSTTSIEAGRAKKKSYREEALRDAQERFLLENQKAQIKRSLGVLDSVERRLLKEPKIKKSKDKKKKKHKKKSKRKSSSSSVSSDSDEEKWVEKPGKTTKSTSKSPLKEKSAPVRDSWMQEDFLHNIPVSDTSAVTKQAKDTASKNREERDMFDKPGTHAKELNPFWKEGGSGLPENKSAAPSQSPVPDVSWLLRSLKRMKEQSEDTGRDIEDIAAERYGSWKTFNDMLDRAQNNINTKSAILERPTKVHNRRKSKERRSSKDRRSSTERHGSRDRRSSWDEPRKGKKFLKPGTDDKYGNESDAVRRKQRRSHSHDSPDDNDDSSASQRKRFRKPDPDQSSSSSRERFRRPDTCPDENSSTGKSSKFRKPGDTSPEGTNGSASSHGRFRKPSDSQPDIEQRLKGVDKHNSNSSARWRKEKYHRESSKENTSTADTRDDLVQSPKPDKPTNSAVEPTASTAEDTNSTKPSDNGSSESPVKETKPRPKILSQEQKNAIGSKILKAELRGNTALAEKLKNKLEQSRKAEEELKNMTASADGGQAKSADDETIILTRMTKTGQAWPVTESETMKGASRKKGKLAKVHAKDGEREKYFADDDQYSLNDLIARERTGVADDHTQVLSRMSAKLFRKTDGEMFTLDDMFESQVAKTNLKSAEVSADRNKAIAQHKKLMRRLEKCKYCFGNPENPKHLIISIGQYAYLSVPSFVPLQPGHCIIAPMYHCSSATAMDENVWAEIRKYMQSLVRMFKQRDQDCVFLQMCSNLQSNYHFLLECIPIDYEVGEMAPIYFKKAIQECDEEWAQNKRVIDTRGCRDGVRGKVPAGLPYFAVDFGLDGGFAHVIENESMFPAYFGREIVGGMIDADPTSWRKPKEQHFSQQSSRTLEFEKWFKEYDWTATEITA